MKKEVAIIGGGTAGLFLASFLDTSIFEVCIYEKMNTLGRKFLVAGDGGFNLTHAEAFEIFKTKYTPATVLSEALDSFTNEDLRSWLSEIGIPTYVGSSGRVFPNKGIKPIEVLQSIKDYLERRGVQCKFNQSFLDWDTEGKLRFDNGTVIDPAYTVFALGGGSWKVTGSDGQWQKAFSEKGILTKPFSPSNCTYKINWSPAFIKKHEGTPLKNLSLSSQNKIQKGEAVVTQFGLEGNAIYGLSPQIRSDLKAKGAATVFVDWKPSLVHESIVGKLAAAKTNTTKALKDTLKLPAAVIDLLKEHLNKDEYLDNSVLAKYIKQFPLSITEAAPIDEAISTSGGVDLNSVDANFQIKILKNQFCIGEMLDWDAPTGGYLIQACASSGVFLAKHLNQLQN